MLGNWKKKWKYISNRTFFFLLLVGSVLLGIMILYASVLLKYEQPLWPLLIWILLSVLLVLFAWYYIIRPYRQCEKQLRRFLDGYLSFDVMGEQSVTLTPYTYEELSKVNSILNSTQMYNLNKRQAQYLALQNQINPHFLYNTLDGIRSEALIAGLHSVADMTEALATFFRYTISKVENLVSVEEELGNCKTYFKIQQYRFGERLKLHIEFDEEDRKEILRCRIPKLTLQPILENSIIHGTELKIGTGNLAIRLAKTESRLLICISDDGVGMDEKTLNVLNGKLGRNGSQIADAEQEKKGGIALANVNHRIQLIFGEEYGIHVFSMEGVGTDVEITIPAITSDREISNQGVLK